MRMVLITVMMLVERNYFKRSNWLAKRTHLGDDDGSGGDNNDDGDEPVITF